MFKLKKTRAAKSTKAEVGRNPKLAGHFIEGTEMLLVPNDPKAAVKAYKVRAVQFEESGTWIESRTGERLPGGAVFLVLFEGRDTLTYYCNVSARVNQRIMVQTPWKVTREKSQLSPDTGRTAYRVTSRFPTEVRTLPLNEDPPIFCHLCDLSQGGMGLEAPADCAFERGQRLQVRLVSWHYPVLLEAEVVRYWTEEEVSRLALTFPENVSEVNRELLTQFILDAQRSRL